MSHVNLTSLNERKSVLPPTHPAPAKAVKQADTLTAVRLVKSCILGFGLTAVARGPQSAMAQPTGDTIGLLNTTLTALNASATQSFDFLSPSNPCALFNFPIPGDPCGDSPAYNGNCPSGTSRDAAACTDLLVYRTKMRGLKALKLTSCVGEDYPSECRINTDDPKLLPAELDLTRPLPTVGGACYSPLFNPRLNNETNPADPFCPAKLTDRECDRLAPLRGLGKRQGLTVDCLPASCGTTRATDNNLTLCS